MPTPEQVVVKDGPTVRNDILRTIKNGLIQRGIDDPEVGPNTDWYVKATAVGNELAVIGANNQIKCDEQMPDTATGPGLVRVAGIWLLVAQASEGSIGPIVLSCSADSPIAAGQQLTDASGLRYQVVVGRLYSDGEAVTVEALDGGWSSNKAEGDVLQWVHAPPFCNDKVLVGLGGLINGIDAEDDEVLRQRVFARLQVPVGSGNWQSLVEDAEASSARVKKGFAYPAVQGPSTADIAVTAAPTATNKSRAVAALTVTGRVAPFVRGLNVTHAELTITTVTDVNADVSFGLSLPEAPTANPPGPGGGWLDGTPWPRPNDSTTWRCTVTGVSTVQIFTVDAVDSPTVGVSHIAWLSPTTWTLYTATVVAVSGTAGAWVVTLDRPFTGITTGCYIWPQPQNAKIYVDAVLAAFAAMGPGEKTTNVSALVRGFRHPPASTGWQASLGPHLLRALNDQEEVLASQFLHRYDGTTTIEGAAGQLHPQVPAAYAAPNILVPRHIAFYRIP